MSYELFDTQNKHFTRKVKGKTPKYNSRIITKVTIRKQLPPEQVVKNLHVMLQDEFIKHHISIGRDNF